MIMAEYHYQPAHDMLKTLGMEMGEFRLQIERDGADLINKARHKFPPADEQDDATA
jgi:hypothetical protein